MVYSVCVLYVFGMYLCCLVFSVYVWGVCVCIVCVGYVCCVYALYMCVVCVL